MRGIYSSRRHALADALERHAPGVELRGLAAGFHAIVMLPEGADEHAIAAEAERRGVGVYPIVDSRFGPDRTHQAPPALVIGFSNLHEDAIDRGVAKIADLLG
jgi:GntR family transcriptional regulator/MocR family aminotransferase